jgi:hypothetical protein
MQFLRRVCPIPNDIRNGPFRFETASADVEPGTVISEFKSGFLYNERVLRPAQVGVSKAPDA